MAMNKSILFLGCIIILSFWIPALATDSAAQNVDKMFKDAVLAWNEHDTEKILSFYTDDCVYEDLAFGVVNRGKGELRKFINGTFAAFPDFNIEMKSAFLSGDWYGMEWVMSGTHKGDIPNLPATGKKFSVRGVSIGELKDGKTKRNSDYYDLMTFLRQIGVMPPPPTPK
jgi:steroid delta-isomerase-like uncharacterized protein